MIPSDTMIAVSAKKITRHDNPVSDMHIVDAVSHIRHDAKRFMAKDPGRSRAAKVAMIGMEICTADSGGGEADDDICRGFEFGLRLFFDRHVVGFTLPDHRFHLQVFGLD